MEYLKQNEDCGLRLNGVKQFVSVKSDTENKEMKNIIKILSEMDIDYIFDINEEETQAILNTYYNILNSNVTKDKYHKLSKSIITVNRQDMQVNAYYISMTKEEYNNLIIKILEQIVEDENILTKIDYIENKIKEIYLDYQSEQTLREQIINYINETIQEIQNNNIGNDEVKIIVYENNGQTVRIAIEEITNELIIDFYNNTSIKVQNVKKDENTIQTNIMIEKYKDETQSNTLILFEQIKNNEIIDNIELNYENILENDQIIKNLKLQILNDRYKSIFNIENKIQLVEQFDNQVTLDVDNIKLYELQDEQKDTIKDILNQNMQAQIENFNSVVTFEEYMEMLQNLNIINNNYIELPEEDKITDIQRKRFNSQFEFFVSENLTTDNIKEMMQIVNTNLYDMKVCLKTGEIEELNLDVLNNNDQISRDYNDNISEMLIYIDQNSKNEDKENEILQFLDINKNYKYTVLLEYDDDGLVDLIRMKIQED